MKDITLVEIEAAIANMYPSVDTFGVAERACEIFGWFHIGTLGERANKAVRYAKNESLVTRAIQRRWGTDAFREQGLKELISLSTHTFEEFEGGSLDERADRAVSHSFNALKPTFTVNRTTPLA